ncbi:MAG: SIR2 family protein [Thermoguttaceae bacterium]
MKKETAMENHEISLENFLNHFAQNTAPNRRYCFILGAGASVESDIPIGGTLAKRWLREIKRRVSESDFTAWKNKHCICEEFPAYHYGKIYEKRFELDQAEGFNALESIIVGKKPSFGYAVLANILASTKGHNAVITTNFDTLTEDAIYTFTDTKPLVLGHEQLAQFVQPTIRRPLIAKIHRDVLLNPRNTPHEISRLAHEWKAALTDIFKIFTPIVIGYGGNDGSLMSFLADISPIAGGIFWCHMAGQTPNQETLDVVQRHNGKFVPIHGFDSLMLNLWNKLGNDYDQLFSSNTPQSEKGGIGYSFDRFSDDEHSKASWRSLNERMANKLGEGKAEHYAYKSNTAETLDKQIEITDDGLKKFPKAMILLHHFSTYLYARWQKENDESKKKAQVQDVQNAFERVYESTKNLYDILPHFPSIVLEKFFDFLHEIGDFDKANEIYQWILERTPNDAETNYKYAELLFNNIQKALDIGITATKIDEHYRRAADLAPLDVKYQFGLIRYLITVGAYYEAEQKLEKIIPIFSIEDEKAVSEWMSVAAYSLWIIADKKPDTIRLNKIEKYLKESFEYNPENYKALCRLIEFYIVFGRLDAITLSVQELHKRSLSEMLFNSQVDKSKKPDILLASVFLFLAWCLKPTELLNDISPLSASALDDFVREGINLKDWDFSRIENCKAVQESPRKVEILGVIRQAKGKNKGEQDTAPAETSGDEPTKESISEQTPSCETEI